MADIKMTEVHRIATVSLSVNSIYSTRHNSQST